MKNIVIAVLGALMLFFILVVVFSVAIIFYSEEPDLTELGEDGTIPMVPRKELLVVTQERDSLTAETQFLDSEVDQRNAQLDSLQELLAFKEATIKTLDDQVQSRETAIADLQTVGVNAQQMARTFATMSVEELTPIVARLNDKVVLDIYKQTSNKRRKFLLTALGDERAASMTDRIVTQKGNE
ncbi:MAG: hypothetical protein KAU50_08870 [Candidatus Marinimicrobia bacterium]|nr:hypothetical protein [Candidatus Neomarinimicrobiota bacterium]